MAVTRRGFLGALTAASYARVLGANDRVRVGFIGYGLIGAQHVADFRAEEDCECAAVSDVYAPRVAQGIEACGGRAQGFRDFRRLLDEKSIDAVVVSTPDHWHALMTVMACAAGKDVYVEKPATLFVREGEWMIKAAARWKRIVQIGVQQRSGPHYQQALALLRTGYLGKVHSVRMASFRNIMPGFGRPPQTEVPRDLDYDLWLGPAPARPYSPHRGLYHFRWFWDFSGGQMTNLGAHSIDILQWSLRAAAPLAVASSGGRFALQDDGETPDTQDALFEYPGFTAVWSHREASAGTRGGSGLEFFGEKGSLKIDRSGFRVHADQQVNPEALVPVFKGHPTGGVNGAREERVDGRPWVQAVLGEGSSEEQFTMHTRNFLDCVKSREEPIASAQDGHEVARTCHLANIALRTGRKLRWDAERNGIAGDAEASAMLERPYRKPWDNVLRGLGL